MRPLIDRVIDATLGRWLPPYVMRKRMAPDPSDPRRPMVWEYSAWRRDRLTYYQHFACFADNNPSAKAAAAEFCKEFLDRLKAKDKIKGG